MTTNTGAAWPLSDKFGCSPDMAIDLLIDAEKMGLEPHGVTFHIGSQQTNAREWGKALKCIALLFNKLRKDGINLDLLNLGGGFLIS
jgi:ornithine decarboxylase